MKAWRHFRSSQRGFTLIEILVVMAIIGVLSAVAGGSYVNSRIRARDAERKSAIAQLQRALELYYNDHNTYPAAISGEIEGINWGDEFTDAVSGTVYMVQLPFDARQPAIQYLYETNSSASKYRIYTRLENTDDMDTDLDGNGVAGDEYDAALGPGGVKTCGSEVCNYGAPSPSTTMEEIW